MTYREFLALHRLRPTASSALAWLKSGQAPVGTQIPAALQAQFGGEQVLTPSTPGVDWPYWIRNQGLPLDQIKPEFFDPPAAPPTPPVTNVNPTPTAGDPYTFNTPQNPYLPQLAALVSEFNTLPQLYNPQRQAVAANTAAQLAASGLVDFARPATWQVQTDATGQARMVPNYTTEAVRDPTGNITYGIVQGADGRAYLQAFSGTAHNFGSRGVFSGSVVDAAQGAARQGLDIQRQQMMSGLQTGQQSVTQDQVGRIGNIGQRWTDYMTEGSRDVTDRMLNQTVPTQFTQPRPQQTLKPMATEPPSSRPSGLTQLTGGQRTVTGGLKPSVSWSQFVKTHPGTPASGPQRTALARAWDRRFNRGRRFGVQTRST